MNSHALKRAELFGDLHRADLSCERGSGSPREQHGGDERAELAQDGNGDDGRNDVARAVALHGDGRLKRQDHSHQKPKKTHHWHRVDANLPQEPAQELRFILAVAISIIERHRRRPRA